MMIAALGYGLCTGRAEALCTALISGMENAVQVGVFLLGTMCFWGGWMRVADEAGLTRRLARLFRPLIRLLFPRIAPDGEAAQAISMNMAANLLGMGNAATPMGLAAMRVLKRDAPGADASNAMITFVVLNTAGFQLIPSTVASLRQAAGSASPFDLMGCIWLTSLGSVATGLAVCFLLQGREVRR